MDNTKDSGAHRGGSGCTQLSFVASSVGAGLAVAIALALAFTLWMKQKDLSLTLAQSVALPEHQISKLGSIDYTSIAGAKESAAPPQGKNPTLIRSKKAVSAVMEADNLARSELSRTPEGRELSIPGIRNSTKIEYRALLVRFAASPEVAGKILDILVELRGDISKADRGDWAPRQRALAETDEKLKRLLGEEGFREVVEFRETLFLRTEFNDLDVRLRYGSAPITAAQLDQLTGLLSRAPGSERLLTSPGIPFPTSFVAEASSVLTDLQMRVLHKIQDERDERSRLRQSLGPSPSKP